MRDKMDRYEKAIVLVAEKLSLTTDVKKIIHP